MTIDTKQLRALVDACKAGNCADADDFSRRLGDLYGELSPESVSWLLDEIEALREAVALLHKIRENEATTHDLRAQVMQKQDKTIELLRENAALLSTSLDLAKQAPLYSTRRNSERYRFLRERILSACRDIDDQGKGMLGVIFKISGDEWLGCDASIDAAMAQAVPT